ncbi:MAG: aconitase X catalytic domain-containing protein [Nitrososphaerota archaeon]|nr:aconitase X catalytic domain-containing protein [Nitrososphaerota archaeon]
MGEPSELYLTAREEKALNGENGEAVAASYRVLLSIGEYLGADRLIPVISAHISGVNYANIGDEGLDFLHRFSDDGRVSVRTTLNPCGIELENPKSLNPPASFIAKQLKIVEYYKKLGVAPTMTCVPYEFDNAPRRGSHVAWAESSACLYANSMMGLKTNKESAISALASAITGKTPNAGMHLDRNRRPGIVVDVEAPLESPTDFGLLGIFAGKLTSKPIGITGVGRITKSEGKALGAGIGTSGSSPMFIILDHAPRGVETVPFTKAELQNVKDENSAKSMPQVVLLGCPFYTLEEVGELSRKMETKKFRVPALLHISRSVYERAEKKGYISKLNEAGARVLKDVCPSLTPEGTWGGWKSVATDSPKGSFYMKSALKYDVNVMGLDDLLV